MFSKNIIYLRKKYKLTQEELGNRLNVSRQTISKWEKGEVVPDSYNLIEISKSFSVKVQDIIMLDISIEDELNEDPQDTLELDRISTESQVKQENKISHRLAKILVLLTLCSIGLIVSFYFYSSYLVGKAELTNKNDEIKDTFIYSNIISAGRDFSVYIDKKGNLKGSGDNTYNQLELDDWNDIVQVSSGGFHTLGLKKDGSVIATGYNNFNQIKVNNWTNIIQVSGGRYHSLGLKENGTVLCIGENTYGACDVDNWKDIKQVSAGRYNSYGLRNDGTVISTNDNQYGQANVKGWTEIIQISAGTYHVIGLKSDGTVICAGGQPEDGACDVDNWKDIKQVVGAGYHSVGLKVDGTVVAVGRNNLGQLDVSNWTNIVAISGGRFHTIAIDKNHQYYFVGEYVLN